MLFRKVITPFNSKINQRFFCKSLVKNVNVLQKLDKRATVQVQGDEVIPFLQGLMTNDMQHLQDGCGSMYAMFLNNKGRVMYDSIIYSTEDPNTFFIECDKRIATVFQKHLKMFKVKKSIAIEETSHNVWALFNSGNTQEEILNSNEKNESTNHTIKDNLFIYKDPRINLLGSRILTMGSVGSKEILDTLEIPDLSETKEDAYTLHRYSLGVGEGINDLPPGNCFPLEANCDYLHGISFHKGCYIGQELTARTHHTGVVRKRIIPLIFDEKVEQTIDNDTPVYGCEDLNTSVGKMRGVKDNHGLGLLRIAPALAASSLSILGLTAKTFRPKWWPEEAPKEIK